MCGRERRNNEFNCHGLIPEGEIVPEGEIEKIDYEWREVYFLDPGKLHSSSEHRKKYCIILGLNKSNEGHFRRVQIPYYLKINKVTIVISSFKCRS